MSTATQRPAQGAKPQQQTAATLLEQILEQPLNSRIRAVNDALDQRIETVREVLPDKLKDQAERLVKRAMLTFNRKDDLHDCDPASLVRCVVEAAELGLAIDGRLAHAVAYNCKVSKKGEPERWAKLAQLQLDYKGLIAVARRSGQIVDAWGDLVCEGEEFEAYRDGTNQILRHTPAFRTGKEKVIGAYAIIDFGGGRYRYELMGAEQIEAIRQRSKSKDKGPWVTDWGPMAVKTVLRRGMKLYCDDPAVGMAIEIDEREYDGEPGEAVRASRRVGRSALNETLAIPPKTVDRSKVPSQRQNQERMQAMEEHFGGVEQGEADQTIADWPAVESAFHEAQTADAVRELHDSLKGPAATVEWNGQQSDEIEQLRVLALKRIEGKGKKQKELAGE